MAKKKISLTEQETQMIERLRSSPRLRKRFEAILELSDSEQGVVKTADEIEAMLIEEIRGFVANTTMEQWALGAEKRIGRNTKKSSGSYCANGQPVVCLRADRDRGEDMAHCGQELWSGCSPCASR